MWPGSGSNREIGAPNPRNPITMGFSPVPGSRPLGLNVWSPCGRQHIRVHWCPIRRWRADPSAPTTFWPPLQTPGCRGPRTNTSRIVGDFQRSLAEQWGPSGLGSWFDKKRSSDSTSLNIEHETPHDRRMYSFACGEIGKLCGTRRLSWSCREGQGVRRQYARRSDVASVDLRPDSHERRQCHSAV
jgi:hypothetical protein